MGLNSILQVLRDCLRFLPVEKKMIRVLFPKDHSSGSVEGEIRVRAMGRTCRDRWLAITVVQLREAKSSSQATAGGRSGENRGLLPRNGPEE